MCRCSNRPTDAGFGAFAERCWSIVVAQQPPSHSTDFGANVAFAAHVACSQLDVVAGAAGVVAVAIATHRRPLSSCRYAEPLVDAAAVGVVLTDSK